MQMNEKTDNRLKESESEDYANTESEHGEDEALYDIERAEVDELNFPVDKMVDSDDEQWDEQKAEQDSTEPFLHNGSSVSIYRH